MIGWFLFKEKTAYELSIRDWSSDVCSSDRRARRRGQRRGLDDERQQRVDDLDGLVVRDADVGGTGGRVGQVQVRSGHDCSSGSQSGGIRTFAGDLVQRADLHGDARRRGVVGGSLIERLDLMPVAELHAVTAEILGE